MSVKEKDDFVKEEPPQGELETLGKWQILWDVQTLFTFMLGKKSYGLGF